jgi:hypothetical protein
MTAMAAALPIIPTKVPAQEATSAGQPAETEEEKKERAVRRECEIKMCAILHKHQPATGVLRCDLRKTWRKEVLTRIMSRGKLSWPWGAARCGGEVKLDRAALIRAMTEPEIEVQFDRHELRCQLEGEKENYDVTLEITPKITFKNGRAVKAALNWGKIEAPTLTKSALWSATAADNRFGVLQSTVVDDINEFIQAKCMEVKEAWQGK